MILSQAEIRKAVERDEIRFDPPLEPEQWGEASVDLRLGFKFAKLRSAPGATYSVAQGFGAFSSAAHWDEEIYEREDSLGKRRRFVIEPNEFVLALTYEHIWMPRNLIAMVEGRSTYARVGLSMHQTAPWIQPGWDGQITLEIRNSGPNNIALTPIDDMPCQLTFFELTSEIPENIAYGSRPTDAFQSQTSPLPTKES